MTVTKSEIQALLAERWKSKVIKIDWLAYEQLIDKIFHSELSIEERNLACMEALDAYTRRGHFDPKNYLPEAK